MPTVVIVSFKKTRTADETTPIEASRSGKDFMKNSARAFALLGTSIAHGQPKPGVDRAYDYLELVGFWEELAQKSNYRNFGSLPRVAASKAYNDLFHKTLEIINSGHRPLLMGGDHSQAFASISALGNKHPDLRILWVDAHADLNTPQTSPSGNSHGMPLSGLLGLVDRNIWGMPWMNQNLKPDQIAYLGVRDIDQGEREILERLQIECYTPQAIREKGLAAILNDLSKRWKGHPLHLSFDIDGLDDTLVPATGTPVGSGLTMDDAKMIIHACHQQFDFISCEVVEFNPDLAKTPDELFKTEQNVKQLIQWILQVL